MKRTAYDLKVDGANIERQISEKQLEINLLKAKLSELNVEYSRMVESHAIQERDAAHANIQQEQAAQSAPAAQPVPVQPVPVAQS